MNKNKPQTLAHQSQSDIESELSCKLEAIPEPCPWGGKVVKLKHELLYSEYSLGLVETRLLYYLMSCFDVSDVFDKKTGRLPNDAEIIHDFKLGKIEDRSMILPMSTILSDICHGSKSTEPLKKAAQRLVGRKINIFPKDGSRYEITPIESAFLYKCRDRKLLCLGVVFSPEFMPYVIGTSGYCKLEMDQILQFKSPLAIRYYHWVINKLQKQGNTNSLIPVTIETLKSRLAISDKKYQKHFFTRCVSEPLTEVAEKARLNIRLEKHFNNQRRGKPLQRVVINSSFNTNPMLEIVDKK
ncbi:replication initiation protein [Vibrio coralliilyticus]|uniref:replication initiation protein n=1 Tax=Vibrio coralliilyticus TaxID=190893 RepID=UPI0017CE0A83|nr:replication initiation protein [Vibrio coralliilyticus]NUW66831.1 replication initiation protein [Vibrio coralliilyticus]